MKLAIITSTHLRHNAFAVSLAEQFDVVGVFLEEKARNPARVGEGTPHEAVVKKYFAERDQAEEDFFGSYPKLSAVVEESLIHTVSSTTDINHPEIVEKIIACAPDYIAVFGSSIIKEQIIDAFPGRIINMHLGLSPYYRGSGTNFWPLYDEKPEYVGVTIHYLDAGIDTGRIIAQARPDITTGDTPHSIGNKTIKAGIVLFQKVLEASAQGAHIVGVPQKKDVGKLCLFKHFDENRLVELQEKFADGLVEKYLQRLHAGTTDTVELVSFVNG